VVASNTGLDTGKQDLGPATSPVSSDGEYEWLLERRLREFDIPVDTHVW
jgi:hypothetical protein